MNQINQIHRANQLQQTHRLIRRLALGAGLIALLSLVVPAFGQDARMATKPVGGASLVSSGLDADGSVHLKVNKSAVLTTKGPLKTISLAQPDIATINQLAEDNILITGKKAGTTQLILWDQDGRSQVINLAVQVDLETLQEQLKQMFPIAKVEAQSVGGALALRGRVPSLQMADQMCAVAAPYTTEKVLNFLEIAGGQQIMLQVRFAEVSRAATSQLGINFQYADGTFFGGNHIAGINPLSKFINSGVGDTPAATRTDFDTNISPSVTVFGAGQVGSFYLQYFISALRQNNLMRLLAEPNLVTTSGQEASFLAGGEFPIPVVQNNGSGGGSSISIEYREFGVRLTFVPVVLGDGRIRLKVSPEVSDLDFTAAVRSGGFLIPGLSKRTINTTVELNEGQTFAIAGLLNNSVVASKDVTPLLGDLPVIGVLFRSVRYQRKETELVVLVTPRLVQALNPSQIPAVPGEQWRHPTESDLFWNRDLGGPSAKAAAASTQPTAQNQAPLRFQGSYGFNPAEASLPTQEQE